ncbi:MAG: hypothetical protein ACLSB9_08715 [Hydrogeniiclostridium mannosilyticum]
MKNKFLEKGEKRRKIRAVTALPGGADAFAGRLWAAAFQENYLPQSAAS